MALEIKDELGTSHADPRRINPDEVERVKGVVINNLGGNVASASGVIAANSVAVWRV
jgi:hypothetical protein